MSKLKESKTNMTIGALFALFSIGFYAETYRFRVVDVINSVDATFVPRITAILVFSFSVLMLVQGYIVYRRIPKDMLSITESEKKKKRAAMVRFSGAFTVMLLAAIVFKKLGFILTMPWTMFALFCIIEKKDKRRYKLYLILSVVSPIIIFLMFYYLFSTLLPVGVLKSLLVYL